MKKTNRFLSFVLVGLSLVDLQAGNITEKDFENARDELIRIGGFSETQIFFASRIQDDGAGLIYWKAAFKGVKCLKINDVVRAKLMRDLLVLAIFQIEPRDEELLEDLDSALQDLENLESRNKNKHDSQGKITFAFLKKEFEERRSQPVSPATTSDDDGGSVSDEE